MTGSTEVLLEHEGASRIEGPLVIVEGAREARYAEMAEVVTPDGAVHVGRVLEVGEDRAVVEIWGESTGFDPSNLRVRFRGRPFRAPVAREMLGRVLDGRGRPRDGLPEPVGEKRVDIHGPAINPAARAYPRSWIQTGISAIDGMNTLVRGQKLPIFSGSGMPHDELTAQIARQARVVGEAGRFSLIFAAIGIGHDTADRFRHTIRESAAGETTALFLNLADDPPMERIITPRVALALAEFLAFEHGRHVLVILTDMTNYAEALRELSTRREEVPTRKGFPGYLYSDLASIYERCGRVQGRDGSVTQMPVLTMPNDDITHPVPDLTGYITEGQIVFDRELHQQGVYPPIDVLGSLSRLMKDGIGEEQTRADHEELANQLYAAYAHVEEARDLAEIIGEEELGATDQRYLDFGQAFEERFIAQTQDEERPLEQTLDRGWQVLGRLPREELTRVPEDILDARYPASEEE
ncbi:MAG: V-type ATP synthase subunit B [Candidatus Longimicrobiales bacterium M2_2A_002]